MSKFDDVRRAYQEAQDLHERNAREPDGREAKGTARIAGGLLFAIGVLLSGGAYLLFTRGGRISPLLTGAAIGLSGLGLYLLVMGKMPSAVK